MLRLGCLCGSCRDLRSLDVALVPRGSAILPLWNIQRAQPSVSIRSDDRKHQIRETIKFVYELRSTIGHGRELSDKQQMRVEAEGLALEQTVREVLVSALLHFPATDPARRNTLAALWDVPSEARVEKVAQELRALSDDERQQVLARTASSQPVADEQTACDRG